MRLASMLAGIAALAVSTAAFAAPVSIAPVSFSDELQREIAEDYGAREGEYLQRWVHEALAAALAERGATIAEGAPLTVEVTVVDADPNRPTMEQVRRRPGLDPMRSISIGGAELRGVLRTRDGRIVSEIEHRRYNHDLRDLSGAESTWTEARRAIRRFAAEIADAYAANAAD